MRGRLYDPVGRTFLTPDPIVANVFDGPSHNPYTYVRNNPIGFTDPSGFWPCIFNCPPTASPTKDAGTAPSPAPAPAVSAPAPPPPTPSPAPAQPTKADAKEVVEARAAAVANAHRESVKQSGGSSDSSSDAPPAIVSTSPVVNYVLDVPLSRFQSFAPSLPLPSLSIQSIALGNVEFVDGVLGGSEAGGAIDDNVRSLDPGQKAIRTAIVIIAAVSGAKGFQALARTAAQAAGGVRIGGAPWQALQPGASACQSGCEVAAQAIQRAIGGEIKTITPAAGRYLGGVRDSAGQFVNPAGQKAAGWSSHQVVLKEGRVYDALTGPQGLSPSQYKDLWEYADALKFGF